MSVLISENHKPNFHGRELAVETRLFANKEMILRFKHRLEKSLLSPLLSIRHHVKGFTFIISFNL